jgi:protein phosphatase 1 regulatory subunit 16A
MPYDICEDDATLDYIESEMAKRGVTQALIEETRSATEMKMVEELRQLRTSGGDMEYRDDQGAAPLHVAAANGYMKVAMFLLEECHVSTDPVDLDGWQPIHAAAVWGHLDVLELLVQNGANLNARTRNGETPSDICEDPDMRDRILQLKNEQEREILKSRDNKLRRSQSTNTRTQSVRRHSIRDKAQTPRKEAREEARIRLQQAFGHPADFDQPDSGLLRPLPHPDVFPITDMYDVAPNDVDMDRVAFRSTIPHRLVKPLYDSTTSLRRFEKSEMKYVDHI